MHPLRLTVHFAPLEAPKDLEPAIAVFHRCIQYGRLEGLVLDVADYRHVPQGPGVMVVGHDVDYSVRQDGFVVTRKRSATDDVGTQLRTALRMGLAAIQTFAYDGGLDASFDPGRFTVTAADRKLGTRDQVAAALLQAVQETVQDLFGDGATVTPVQTDDPRTAPSVAVQATDVEATTVLDALGGPVAAGQSPWDISVEEFAALKQGGDVVLVDVREASEYEIVNLDGRLMPLATLDEHVDELDAGAHIVVHCRAGWRGAKAVQQLRDAGFTNTWNVNGGLMAWIDRIDPSLPRY